MLIGDQKHKHTETEVLYCYMVEMFTDAHSGQDDSLNDLSVWEAVRISRLSLQSGRIQHLNKAVSVHWDLVPCYAILQSDYRR